MIVRGQQGCPRAERLALEKENLMCKIRLVLATLTVMLVIQPAVADGRRDATRNQDLADGSQLVEAALPAVGDTAGFAIAVRDDLLVVGAPNVDPGYPPGPGQVFVHNWDVDTRQWDYSGELSSLLPEGTLHDDSFFGFAVDIYDHPIDGVRVIVGAPMALNESGVETGRVFVFRRSILGMWTLEQILDNSNESPNGRFGERVALSETLAFITAGGETNETGGTGTVWSSVLGREGEQRVVRMPRVRGDVLGMFGSGLDYDGGVLVIGAAESVVGGVACGQAHVYSSDDDFPIHVQTLNVPGVWNVDTANFGFSVAVDVGDGDGTLLVGTPSHNPSITGGAVSYALDTTWIQQDLLVGSDPQPVQLLGHSVALMGGRAVAGAPYGGLALSGHAVVFEYSPSAEEWRVDATLTPEMASVFDFSGGSVAVGPVGVMIGSPYLDTDSGDQTGGVFAYFHNDDGWQSDTRPIASTLGSRHVIANPTWTEESQASFGASIALSDNTAIIGDPTGDADGRVHLYTRTSDGDVWTNQAAPGLSPPPEVPADTMFGRSLGLSEDLAIVGAARSHGTGTATLFQRSGGVWSSVITLTGQESDQFGWSVDIESLPTEAFFVVGAPLGGGARDDRNGQVYLYRWDEGTQSVTLETTFEPHSIPAQSEFGVSVDLDIDAAGDVVVVVGNTREHEDSVGSVEILRRDHATGVWAHEQTIEPGDEFSDEWSTLGFGWDVAIEDGLLVVGAPYSGLYGYYSGDAMLFRASASSGPATWSLESYLDNPTGRSSDLFGWSVELSAAENQVFVGNPNSDYMGRNAGLVAVFEENPGAVWDDLDWINTKLNISTDSQPDDLVGFQLAVDGSTLLATAYAWTNIDPATDRPYFADFLIEDMVCWSEPTGPAYLSNPASWAVAPDGAATGVFSLLLADEHQIIFDLFEWVGSLRVELDQIVLDLQDADRSVTGSIHVAAPADIRTAGLSIESGTLHIGRGVHIGSGENTGILHVLSSGMLEVNEQLSINAESSMQLSLSESLSGARVQTWSVTPELGGGLRVDLGDIQDPSALTVGDRFVLISCGLEPTGGLFDAIVLPGLPDGLAFEVQYGPPDLRSGGGCPVGELEDCFGNCCPAIWVGDGWCDDGSYEHNGVPIYLNCASLGCDGGDCVGCWNDGGEWEMAIEVISLAGLLDFGDPESAVVPGDPTGVEVVDLTGDFAEEICVTLAGSPGSLVIFENDGAGGVSQQIIIPTGDEPVDITSGDFDGDGNNDLAVANNLSQDVSIYYNDDNDPSDGFATIEDLDVDGPPTCLAGINADYDLYDDLVVGLEYTDGDSNGYWAIYLGVAPLRNLPGGMVGGGGIAPSGTPLGADPSEEEDQKDYLFGGRQSDGKTSTVKGSGALRGVTLTITEHTTGADPGGITTGDVNGDGNGDICVTSTTNGTVAILLQDAGSPGDFLPAIFVPVGDEPTRITSVDFDNDGNIDLAAIVQELNPSSGLVEPVVRVLQGNGGLSFTSLETAWDEDVVLVDSGDVSGDGASELVTIGGGTSFRGDGGSPLLTLRDVTTPTCPGDFDGTGDVGIDDLLILLGEFAECTSGCQSDMDSDGDVDIDDMLALIGAWGVCPR